MSKTNEEFVKNIAKAVMNEQKRVEKKTKREKRDWRLRNTTLLLKNYRKLRSHCDGIIEDVSDFEKEVFDPSGLHLPSLLTYKAKTAKMLDFVDAQLKAYEAFSSKAGHATKRRCAVVQKLHIQTEPMSKVDIAFLYGVDESTIRRDEAKAIEEISYYIFGIDSLEDFMADNAQNVP